jgi:hypothetical protein
MLPLSSGASIVIIPRAGSWAYGGSKEVNLSGTATGPDGGLWYFVGNAYFGWAVVHQQFNTSSSTFEIFSQRTMAAHYNILYCRPDCSSPRVTVNSTVFAWETNNVWANFTRDGTVYVSGVATPAIAMMNLSATSQANITITHTASNSELATYLQLAYGSAAVNSAASLTFQPSLGLFPVPQSLNESWTSASNFNGSGSWTGNYHLYGPAAGLRANSFEGNLQRTGNVTLTGKDIGSVVLSNGKVGQIIALQLNGPFRLVDGWFPVLSGADLFSGVLQTWMTLGHMGLSENTGAVDVASNGGSASVVAATNTYTPNTDTPSAGTSSISALDSPFTASSGVPQSSIQAEPMSLTAAQNLVNSLLSPFAGPSGAGSTPVRGVLIAAVAGVVLVAVVAAYSMTRKKSPPARHSQPNSRYHNISKEAAAEGQTKSAESASKEDSLGYLM